MYSKLKSLVKGYVRYAYLRRARDYRRVLDARLPRLRYVGWLGHENIGDEVLFETFRDELFTNCLLVPHGDVSLLSAIALRARTSAVVLGGGTLINDKGHIAPLLAASRAGLPFFAFGTGVCDPEYWREFPRARTVDTQSWLQILAEARYVGVRGPRSCDWLRSHGIKAEVLGDPALSVPAPPTKPMTDGAPPLLGVNLGTHDPVLGAQGADFNAVVALVRTVLAKGWRVKYLAMHPIDQRIGEQLKSVVSHPLFELAVFNPDSRALLRDIASCRCVVGERLHVTVLACAVSVPNLSLSYQPKCLDFLESIGRSDLAVETRDIHADGLIERFEWLQACSSDIAQGLRKRCDELRSLQMLRAAEVIAALPR